MNPSFSNQYLREISLKDEKITSYDEYPFSLPVIKNLKKIKFHPSVTFIIGENGTGKSTLLEAIAVAMGFNPEGGTKNFDFKTNDTHSNLYEYIRLTKGIKHPKDGFFLRAESFYNVASNIDKLDEEPSFGPPIKSSYGGKSLHHQSHGESFFSLMMHRFGGNGIYILDEPEAALSPTRQMSLIARMHELVNNNSQFIIATHSPIIMAYPKSNILSINEEFIEAIKYTDTEHFIVTKNFLNKPDKLMKELLQEE